MPDEAPVTRAVEVVARLGQRHERRLSQPGSQALSMIGWAMEEPFNPFGDPEELQRRLGEFAEQMQGAQQVSFADNAIISPSR